jgi:hypothetical protein
VYRPKLAAPARSESMVAQKVDERHPVIQHGTAAPAHGTRSSSPASATGASASAADHRAKGEGAQPVSGAAKAKPSASVERPASRGTPPGTGSTPSRPASAVSSPTGRSGSAGRASSPAGETAKPPARAADSAKSQSSPPHGQAVGAPGDGKNVAKAGAQHSSSHASSPKGSQQENEAHPRTAPN